MTGTALVRPVSAIVWELRAAWAAGRRVSLSLDSRCEWPRAEGRVRRVAASGAFVVVAGQDIPLDAVLAVHLPSRLGDSTIEAGERFHGRGRRAWRPQSEALWRRVLGPCGNSRDFVGDELGWLEFGAAWDRTAF